MKKLLSILKMEFLVNDYAFKNWRVILFLSLLSLMMIASGHAADRKIFQIAQLNDDLKMLKSISGVRRNLKIWELGILLKDIYSGL